MRADVSDLFQAVVRTPADSRKLLMLGLVEQAAKSVYVRQIPGIKSCYAELDDEPAKGEAKPARVTTEGVYFKQIWERDDIIDLKRIDSNDIWAIMQTYGM